MFKTEYERLDAILKDDDMPVHTENSNGEKGVIYRYEDPVNGKYYQQITFLSNGSRRIITNYENGINEEFIHDGKSVRKVF